MTAKPIIIDCDPGLDDAVALFLAFAAKDTLDILAVTTVAGNVPLDLTTRNARIIRQLAGRGDVPIYAGCPSPMLRAPVFAADFHGDTGLEGITPFEPDAPVGDGHAVLRIVELLRASEAPVQVIATGPLTNIASALVLAPDIADKIDELVIMGGASAKAQGGEGGNITPHAEFNIYADPDAAAIVFSKRIPIVIFSLDFTHTVRSTLQRITAIRQNGNPASKHVANLLDATNQFQAKMTGEPFSPLHDPCPIIYAIKPDLFGCDAGSVSVVTEAGDHYGETVFTPQERGLKWITNWPGEDASDAIYALLTAHLKTL